MLRAIGNFAGRMRRMATEFRSQFDDAIREVELDDMRKSMESIRDINPLKGVKDSVKDGIDSATGGKKSRARDKSDADKPDADKPAADKPAADKPVAGPALETASPETDPPEATENGDTDRATTEKQGASEPGSGATGRGA